MWRTVFSPLYPGFFIPFSPLPPSLQGVRSPWRAPCLIRAFGAVYLQVCVIICSVSASSARKTISSVMGEKGKKGERKRRRGKGRFLHQPHSWAALGPTAKFSLPRVSDLMEVGRSGKGPVPVKILVKIYTSGSACAYIKRRISSLVGSREPQPLMVVLLGCSAGRDFLFQLRQCR